MLLRLPLCVHWIQYRRPRIPRWNSLRRSMSWQNLHIWWLVFIPVLSVSQSWISIRSQRRPSIGCQRLETIVPGCIGRCCCWRFDVAEFSIWCWYLVRSTIFVFFVLTLATFLVGRGLSVLFLIIDFVAVLAVIAWQRRILILCSFIWFVHGFKWTSKI